LLGKNSVNSSNCYGIAATVMLATTDKRNSVFRQSVPRGYKQEDFLERAPKKLSVYIA
jgi:hypothetical protein